MNYYKRNLPHIQQESRPHFITFATHKRAQLSPSARDIVLTACHHHHERTCDLLAAVIMPDHVHLILAPLIIVATKGIVPLHWITRSIKGYSARQINKHLQRTGQIWQDESFDHIIRKGDFHAKLDYLLQNPVKNGLAETWQEYRWCYWKGSVSL
jgi:REP element-mobilizing transposase RayT